MTAVPDILALALRQHQAGRLGEAERVYRSVLAAEPEHVGCLHLLGLVALRCGRYDEAVDLIGRALARQPDFAEAHSNLGIALHKRGDLDRAITHWERAIALQPHYPDAHVNLGSALRHQGRLAEAIERYERALALRPDHAQANRQLDLALREEGRHLDEAAARCEQAPDLKPGLAGEYFKLGRALRRRGRLDEAIGRYEQALALSPNFAEAHLDIGIALQQQREHEEAVIRYRRAIALNPDLAEAHFNLGVTLYRLFGTSEAISCFERVLALRPGSPGAIASLRVCRADAMVHAGNLPGAVAHLEEGLRQEFSAISSAVSTKPAASPGHPIYANALQAVLRCLAAGGIEAFLIGGALLGAIREGDFLAFDKDIDFGIGCEVAFAELDRAFAGDAAFERVARPDQPALASYRFRKKVGIDFFHFFPEGDVTWCGLSHGPYLIKWLYRPFGLKDFDLRGLKVKIPDDAERFLTEEYGDWRTPNPYFGLFASPNIEGGYSLLLRKIAYSTIFVALVQHDRERTISLCDQVLARDPDDGLIRDLRERMAAG